MSDRTYCVSADLNFDGDYAALYAFMRKLGAKMMIGRPGISTTVWLVDSPEDSDIVLSDVKKFLANGETAMIFTVAPGQNPMSH